MGWKNYAYFLLVIVFLLVQTNVFSQDKKLWTKVNTVDENEQLLETNTIVQHQQIFDLDINQFKQDLTFDLKSNKETKIIELPDADGSLLQFRVYESSILHPELAKKFPSIKSYRGQEINDATQTVQFTINDLGLHAMVSSPKKGTMYIDPITKNRKKYSIYYKKHAVAKTNFECSVVSDAILKAKNKVVNQSHNDLKLRTFRLAIATTEEYSNFHVNAAGVGSGSSRLDSITAVLSAIVVAMDRVNSIFERDVALTMQLVSNNDQLIYLETDLGNDPYTNSNGSAMLIQNQNTVNNVIGIANYDIGHVFSTGGGGVADLASVCGPNKAKGVTGSSFPSGDSFNVDYVAHEIGHQFGANHTFNGNAGNCGGGNRNNLTAVEPGSGSSLMGYAGICGSQQNVQGNSDSYFHIVSIVEIYDNITNGFSQCATTTNFISNMNVPIANAGADYTIPKSTPFVLRGQGTDADGDVLTYCWEQVNNEVNGILIPPSTTQTVGAIFRSYPPKLDSKRYFPSMEILASGTVSVWEVLPSVSRTIDFSLAVRDNKVGEGQVAADNTQITVNDAAGPFVVTSQNASGISWTENDTELITWDVAGTDSNGINEGNVNILMSSDGGLTFPTILASNTPNDGSESIIVPNTPSPSVRIMVQAIANIFFAVNSENITIGNFQTSCSTYVSTDIPKQIPDANTAGVVSTISVPSNFLVSDVNVSLDISHTWLLDLQIYLKSPNGTEVLIYDRTCGPSGDQRLNINATFDDAANAIVCNNSIPAISGNTKASNLLSAFNGLSSLGNWQLRVVDNSSDDIGTLNNWSIELCQTNQTVGVDDFNFNTFNVYPNPSTGQIQLRLDSPNTESVKVLVYDLQGRQVFTFTDVNTTSKFNKLLDFSSLAKGVYLLKVFKGKLTGTRKIILY